jgi:hypothetical protein
MVKKKKAAAKSAKPAKKKTAGGPRACGVCNKLGHNARSHAPGGRLAK